MTATSITKDSIQRTVAESENLDNQIGIKVLFAPVKIHEGNLQQTAFLYKAIQRLPFESFVIVETVEKGDFSKKLPMPSVDSFETPFGKVLVNDALRNDFADEEDDFYIDDAAMHPDMSLYQQLMLLQSTRKNFDVVSIQIADSRPAIIRELSWVLSEVLSIKNAMVIFCCELDAAYPRDFEEASRFIESHDVSGLMNFLNGGTSHIKGGGAFLSGLMVAHAWELKVKFTGSAAGREGNNLLAGYAALSRSR